MTNSNILPLAYVWGRTLSDPLPNYPGNGSLNYTADNYALFNPTAMVLSPPSFNPPFNQEGILSSCQSFNIITTNGLLNKNNMFNIQSAGNVVFNNSMRSLDNNNRFMRTSENPKTDDTKLWLSITDDSGKSHSQLVVAFLEKANDGFDEIEDVKTFCGRSLGLYTKTTKQDLIIDAQGSFNDKRTLPLGITNLIEEHKKFTITIDKASGQLTDHDIYIFDRLTSKIVDITKQKYGFVSNAKIMDDRFTILFQNKIETEITDLDQAKVVIFSNDGKVIVNSLTDKRIQSVYVSDLYTPSVGGIEIAKTENINNKMFSFGVDSKYKLLNIKVVLEDGTIVNKKVMP